MLARARCGGVVLAGLAAFASLVPGRCQKTVLLFSEHAYGPASSVRYLSPETDVGSFAVLASSLLAAVHCESGNNSIVDDICPGGSEQRVSFLNTNGVEDASVAVSTLLDQRSLDFVVSSPLSSIAVPLAIVGAARGVGQIAYWSTSPELDKHDRYRLFSRTIPSDAGTAQVAASLMQYYGLSDVGMIYSDDTYGNGFRDEMLLACSSRGVRLHALGVSSSVEDAAHNLMDVQRLNVVFLVLTLDSLAALVAGLVEHPHRHGAGKLLVFSDGISLSDLESVAALSPRHRAALEDQQFLVAEGGDERDPRFQRFRAAFAGVAGETLARINSFLPGGARYVQASGGMRLSMAPLSARWFASAARELRLVAPFAYDAVALACRALCKSANGTAAALGVTQGLFAFDGASGRVQVDNVTSSRRPETVHFAARRVQFAADGAASLVPMFSFSPGGWGRSPADGDGDGDGDGVGHAEVRFPGGVASMPTVTDVPVEDKNLIGPHIKALMFALSSVVLVTCGAFGAWIAATKRRNALLLKSQPHFMLLCLFGISVSVLSVYPLSVEDADGSNAAAATVCCNAAWALWSVGTTISSGALLGKLWRVLKVFNNPNLRAVAVTNAGLYRGIVALLVVNMALLAAWFASAPYVYQRTVLRRDPYGNALESFGACEGSPNTAAFTAAVLVYDLGLVGTAASIAYRVRNVDADFQESGFLFIALLMTLQLCMVAVPVLVVLDGTSTNAFFLVLCTLVCLNGLALALLLMLPKLMARAQPAPQRRWGAARLVEAARSSQLSGAGSSTQHDDAACAGAEAAKRTVDDDLLDDDAAEANAAPTSLRCA